MNRSKITAVLLKGLVGCEKALGWLRTPISEYEKRKESDSNSSNPIQYSFDFGDEKSFLNPIPPQFNTPGNSHENDK